MPILALPFALPEYAAPTVPIPAASVQTLCDSVAKHLGDLVARPGSTAGLIAGQAATLAHVAALDDAGQEYSLMDSFEQLMANENAWLTLATAYTGLLDLARPAVVALDAVCGAVGGLRAFCRAEGLQVAPGYLDAHNRAAARFYGVTPLSADVAFGAALSNLGKVTVSGPGAGTFAVGASEAAAYGNAPLSLVNAGSSATGASSGTYRVTYSLYDVAGNLVTGATVSATIAGGTLVGAGVALGVAGIAVTGITVVSGGNASDVLACTAALLRAVSY